MDKKKQNEELSEEALRELSNNKSEEFCVKVTANALNVRTGAGTNYASNGCIRDRGVYTIVAVSDGQGSEKGWGKLKSGVGWISLDYAVRV